MIIWSSKALIVLSAAQQHTCRECLCEDCHVWVQYTSDGQWIETMLTVLCVYLEHSCNLCLTMLDERDEWTFTGNGWRRQTERSLTIGHHPPPLHHLKQDNERANVPVFIVLNLTHLRIYSKCIFASHSRSKITHYRFLVIQCRLSTTNIHSWPFPYHHTRWLLNSAEQSYLVVFYWIIWLVSILRWLYFLKNRRMARIAKHHNPNTWVR